MHADKKHCTEMCRSIDMTGASANERSEQSAHFFCVPGGGQALARADSEVDCSCSLTSVNAALSQGAASGPALDR